MNSSRVRLILASMALLILAGGIRFTHLDWGLPDVEEEALPAKKAFEMWGWEDGETRWDPETAGWPALSFYVQLATQKLQYGIGRLSGSYSDPLDYYVAYEIDPSPLILWARVSSALASLLVVWIAALLGWRIAGAAGAMLAGGLVTFSPLLVQHAQMVEPDVWVTAFSALTIWKIFSVQRDGRPQDYIWAGIFAGLGTASKYTPILLTVSLFAVHLERRKAEGKKLGLIGLDDRRLGWAAIATVLAFLIASPFTLSDIEVLRRDFAYQAMHMSSGHFGHEAQGVGYGYYLFTVLPRALGWPALVLGILGILSGLKTRKAEDRVVLWCFLPFFLVLGGLNTHFDRYMLPVVLPIALGVAVGWRLIVQRLPRLAERQTVVAAVFAVVLMIWPARGTLQTLELQGTPSTQQQATRWVEENLDQSNTVLALEYYGPILPYDERNSLRNDPVFGRLSEEQREKLLQRPFYEYQILPMYSARVELTAYYYQIRHFLYYDYIVTSGGVRSRYLANTERFPEQAKFYADLDRFCELVHMIKPEGKARGPQIRFYRMSEESRKAILANRGRLDPSHYRAWTSRVHAPDFHAFTENVALHAELKKGYRTAGDYFQILAETMPDEQRNFYLERTGVMRFNDKDLDAAELTFQALIGRDPANVIAIGNLGLLAEKRGDLATARAQYERCASLAPDERTRAWAQNRLRVLSGSDTGQKGP